jgi:hypothetical protein
LLASSAPPSSAPTLPPAKPRRAIDRPKTVQGYSGGPMEHLLQSLPALLILAAVVVLFRLLLRRPKGVSFEDAPGVRTVAIFEGDAAELFAEDVSKSPFVGVRLFRELCDALAAGGAVVAKRGTEQYAQRAECLVDDQGPPLALVLEWLDPQWLVCVEYVPRSGAERRHLGLTKQVFTPLDSPALHKFLPQLDACLKADRRLRNVRWLRKQDWLSERVDDTRPTPIRGS